MDLRPVPLTEGFFEPSGIGDVHVWPCLDAAGCAVVVIELVSDEGRITVQLPARDVHDFNLQMQAVVPLGQEAAAAEVREELDALIASSRTPSKTRTHSDGRSPAG